MAGGFLNLAYMAELAFVANLAYLELKSLRYVEKARAVMPEVLLSLNDAKKNGSNVFGEQFMDLYIQARDMFHDDGAARKNAWYIPKKEGGRKNYEYCAGLLYSMFVGDRDKIVATLMLIASGLIIFTITLLSHYVDDGWAHTVQGHALWRGLMVILSLAIVMPTFYVGIGRRIKKISERVSDDIKARKDAFATTILDSRLDQARKPARFAPSASP